MTDKPFDPGRPAAHRKDLTRPVWFAKLPELARGDCVFVSQAADGDVYLHREDGRSFPSIGSDHDLINIPDLVEVVVWVVVDRDGQLCGVYQTEARAKENAPERCSLFIVRLTGSYER